tara:strand:+ start:1049 stop:2578 length:1530 start_codon:yes stop_codon:yes gene_type:complete
MLGLGNTLRKASGALSSYVRDGLKLYMPYSSPKEIKFVGQGSTSFDGSDDYIDCGTDSSLTVGTSDFTACAWVKLSSKGGSDYHDIVARGDTLSTGNGWGLNFNETNNAIYFDIGNTSSDHRDNITSGNNVWEYNKWHHIAVSRVNSTNMMNMYLDGVLIKSLANNDIDDIGDSSSNFRIGRSDDTRYAKGNIKNVGFWKRALSATEVQNVMYKTYDNLSGTLKQGMESWWSLDNIAGWLGTITAIDSNGTNHGTNSGSTPNTSLYGGVTPLIPRGVDNAPTVQADAIGTGYASFIASGDDYIDCGDAVSGISDYPFTVAGWFRAESVGTDGYLFSISDLSESDVYYGVYVRKTAGEGELRIVARNTTTQEVDTGVADEFNDDTWHHFAAVYTNATDMKLYTDGIYRVQQTTSVTFNSGTDSFAIGIRKTSGGLDKEFQGDIKNVGIWSGALTQPQIQSIMEKTYSELTSSEKTNLTSWWGLDTETGTDGQAGTGGVKDEHGSNHGTLN